MNKEFFWVSPPKKHGNAYFFYIKGNQERCLIAIKNHLKNIENIVYDVEFLKRKIGINKNGHLFLKINIGNIKKSKDQLLNYALKKGFFN